MYFPKIDTYRMFSHFCFFRSTFRINYLHKEMKELQDRNKILSTENCQMSLEYTAFKEQVLCTEFT